MSAPFSNKVLHNIVVFTISSLPCENNGKNKLKPSLLINLTSAPLFIKKFAILYFSSLFVLHNAVHNNVSPVISFLYCSPSLYIFTNSSAVHLYYNLKYLYNTKKPYFFLPFPFHSTSLIS